MKVELIAVTALAGLICGQAPAYEIETHAYLSGLALKASILANSSTARSAIGLRYELNDIRQRFPDSKSNGVTVLELIQNGTEYEDDFLALPPRPLNHFFDPTTGEGLYIDPWQFLGILPTEIIALIATVNATSQASPDWALDSTVANSVSRKALSNFMFDAYTRPQKAERDAATGRVFETIGRLIHHVQDMAQPQHVRNDAHLHFDPFEQLCPTPPNPGLEDPVCPIYRALRAPSIYEQWTKSLPESALTVSGYAPVYGAEDRTTFAHPRRFWIHDGKGLAEFTSRNFVSAGTMRRGPPSIGAASDVRAGDLCAGAVPACEVQYLDYYVRFFASNVDDRLRPTAGGTNPRAAAESIYSADFKRIVAGPEVLTVNRFTFKQDHDYLLPRAVAYSAGLIDYIFRGEIRVAAPAEGVYGIVDSSSAGCGSPCGFRKLRMRLQNMTPGNEAMGPGHLHAIVKYHRNQCHKADLSGHYGGPQFTGDTCRLGEEIAVSEPLLLSGTLTREDAGELKTFNFPLQNVIPIEATEVRLQVLFRGRLGQEDDAVAITTVDIAEPNFVGVANNTDHYFDPAFGPNGGYRPADATNAPFRLDTVKVWFADPATQAGPIASLAPLDGGQHAQFAFLGDKTAVPYWLRTASQQAYYDGFEGDAFPVQEFVLDETASPARYWTNCPVVLARGMYRQYVQMYVREQGGRIAVKSTAPKGGSKDGVEGKLAAMECYDWVAPGQGGISDFSTLTPQFTPTTASQWTIGF